jgi:hypothetical protein
VNRSAPGAEPEFGWRDYCIVNAPERSGLGTLELLRALVSALAFVVAKRWDVGSRCVIRMDQGAMAAVGVVGVCCVDSFGGVTKP